MRISYPSVRSATSRRTRIVRSVLAAIIPAFVLSACGDAPTGVRAPSTTAQKRTNDEPGARAPIAAAGLVFCDVAVLTRSGNYRVRNATIKVPRDIFDANDDTRMFAYRGWTDASPDPVRLALCQIPATAAAEAFFAKGFNAAPPTDEHPIVKPKNPGIAKGLSLMIVDDGTYYDGEVSGCDPYALVDYGCECTDASCNGWDDGGGTSEGTEPALPEPTDFYMGDGGESYYYDSYSDSYYVAAIACYGQTDRPHLSGTPGYFGNVNVHGRTWCTTPTSITVSTTLSREKCFWVFFCWWSTVGSGYRAAFGLRVDTPAPAYGCSRGWYLGSSYHTAVYPTGPAAARTSNAWYIYC